MQKNNQIDPRKNFVPHYLPWVLGAVMLVVYGLTLNHWVTLLNILQVASVSGWTLQPQVYAPLTFLVTLPFHLFPTGHIPFIINIFSALCAAASLAILARSVAILPHDRTDLERWRERSDFSFLTAWVAWIPPVTAVIFAGLQLGFWESATSFTGESFQLLLFAVTVWQMLEYRLDEQEGRLFFTAFLFGASLVENWAMVGFIPIYWVMIIWLRGLSFFNLNFLLRMALWGLAGFLLLLLVVTPLLGHFSGGYPLSIWESIKSNLRTDWQVARLLDRSDVRHDLALMSLTSLLPAFAMAIRWSSSFGDSSRMGTILVNYMMHFVNAVFLGLLVWVTFDPPFSPRRLTGELGMPVAALTFYYITALCIGYYVGYFLLVFGRPPVPSRRNRRPDPALPGAFALFCPVIVGGMIASLLLGAGLLIYKNTPIIQAVNDDSLLKYAQFATQNLPRDGAILLCDSDDPGQFQPVRAYLIQAELAREGRTHDFPVVDTRALNLPFYHNYLHRQFPKYWPPMTSTNDIAAVSPLHLYMLLNQLSKSNNLCYLNPSFGYYFEQFYQEPHGLTYAMKLLPENSVLPPALDKSVIAENMSFWGEVLQSSRGTIEKAIRPAGSTKKGGFVGWIMMHLHVAPEPNANAILAGTYYSRSLNTLGVQVQRAGQLENAAELFNAAQDLNTNNIAAGVNLAFNKTLRSGFSIPANLSPITPDQFGRYRTWNEVLTANGPFDEPSFCFDQGCWLMQAGLMRQAAVPFDRVRQLLPDNLAARLFLAQIYIFARQSDSALEMLREPMAHPFRFGLTEYSPDQIEVDVLAAGAHFQKNENAAGAALLDKEVSRHPDNETLLLAAAQVLNMRGLYTNSLHVINLKLARTPNDPTWLYGKGIVSLRIGAYDDAVKALSQFLEIQTNNPDAIFNRGYAYFQSGKLDSARADFRQLQKSYTNNFHVAYGLGEIAWRQHETNEAIRNYQIFLANAPTNAPELKDVRERLTQIDDK